GRDGPGDRRRAAQRAVAAPEPGERGRDQERARAVDGKGVARELGRDGEQHVGRVRRRVRGEQRARGARERVRHGRLLYPRFAPRGSRGAAMDEDLLARVTLCALPNLTRPRARRALETGRDPGGVLARALATRTGERALERAAAAGIRALAPSDPDFPSALRAIPDPPL